MQRHRHSTTDDRPNPFQCAPGVRRSPARSRSRSYRLARNTQRRGLDSQVAGALSKAASAGRHAMSAAGGALADCVAHVGGGKVPLLVDSATYEGRAATVIALPAADAAHADVWIVGAEMYGGRHRRARASPDHPLKHHEPARVSGGPAPVFPRLRGGAGRGNPGGLGSVYPTAKRNVIGRFADQKEAQQ